MRDEDLFMMRFVGTIVAMPRPTKRALPVDGGAAAPTTKRRNGTAAPVPRGSIEIGSSDAVTRPLKTSERVALNIAHDIIARRLKPGDSLPPEAAMLEVYSVSRESLREGLRLLEVQGLITIRRGPGGGPVVGTVDPANLGRMSTLYFHMAGATYAEVFEAWVVSEGIIAERAARNPDAELRRKVMAPYMDDDHGEDGAAELDSFVRSHVRFHGAIASLVQNRVLELSLQVFGQIVSHHAALEDDPRELKALIAHDHLRLAQAIVSGQPTRARNIMVKHIEAVRDFTASKLGTRINDYVEWK